MGVMISDGLLINLWRLVFCSSSPWEIQIQGIKHLGWTIHIAGIYKLFAGHTPFVSEKRSCSKWLNFIQFDCHVVFAPLEAVNTCPASEPEQDSPSPCTQFE
jgi:hypothetical protein